MRDPSLLLRRFATERPKGLTGFRYLKSRRVSVHQLLNLRTVLSVAATALFVGGCATTEAVERAQTTADQALQEARQAQQTATQAQQSADQAKSMIEQHEQNYHRRGQRG
jgi:hypothetical protein